MNLQIGRSRSLDGLGSVPARMSEQVAYNLAPIIELLGIETIRLSEEESVGGPVRIVAEHSFFEGVPDEIARWSEPAVHAVGAIMSAFGLISMELSPEPSDESGLIGVWNSMLDDSASSKASLDGGVMEWGVSPGTGGSIEVSSERMDSYGEYGTSGIPDGMSGVEDVIVL